MDIDIPHPKVETVRIAEKGNLPLPCNNCTLDYICEVCDGAVRIPRINNSAELVEYLVSPHYIVRALAHTRFKDLQDDDQLR